jgi:Ca2+-binding EF-hand superfamily protein
MRKSVIPGHNNNRHLTGDELEHNIGDLPVTEPKIRELFDKLDVNGNGLLDFNEVKKFYKSFENYGLEPTDSEIEAQMRKYAKRPDGKLNFDEFTCIVLTLAQR